MTPNGCTRACSCSPRFRSPDPHEGRSTRFKNSRSASRPVVRVVDLPGLVKDVSGYLDKHTESDLAARIEAVPRFTGPVPTRLSEVSAEPVYRLWPARVSRAARATPPDTRWTQPRVGARG